MKSKVRFATILACFIATNADAACSDPPAQGVDWAGCNFESARLATVDLRDANLRGAIFRDADLRRANLEGADVDGADFSHADLSRTIWHNGVTCAIASDGECD